MGARERTNGRSAASRRGRRSRTKGRDWQAELARRWRELGLFPAAVSSQGGQVRRAVLGPKPSDVEGTPFAIEAKHEKQANPIGALRQEEAEAKRRDDARPAIAVVRPHGCGADEAVVVMRLLTFELLAEAAGGSFTLADLEEARRRLAMKVTGATNTTAPARLPADRCAICDWPLAATREDGCVAGNCSYRPADPAEVARIRARREALAMGAA